MYLLWPRWLAKRPLTAEPAEPGAKRATGLPEFPRLNVVGRSQSAQSDQGFMYWHPKIFVPSAGPGFLPFWGNPLNLLQYYLQGQISRRSAILGGTLQIECNAITTV